MKSSMTIAISGGLLAVCSWHTLIVDAATSAGTHPAGAVTQSRLLNADSEPGQWVTAGRDWRQSYYSPLTQINKRNVRQLSYAWSYDIDFTVPFQATPIVVDGVMFTSGNGGSIYSVDAKSGILHWSFEPEVNPDHFPGFGFNRGVAVWQGKVYVASRDGCLYALDATTGAVMWKVDTITDRSRSYFSTGAPYIAGNAVIIGNAGAEYDVRGYITAYDLVTGKEEWRFFIVPGDLKKGFEHPELEMAAKTWDPNSRWDLGLGGTAWDGMAYDPALNLLYVGTGNGLPWRRDLRSRAGGDNLFLSSILAINPDTGRLVWHYQTTPADNWDYTATAKPILADLTIDGKLRKVLLQAPKNGFFYVLDRATGELLSAKPFAYINWASHVDLKTGRPVETGKADYSHSPKLVFPTNAGAHNWQPMSYNPGTGLVYIPTVEAGEVYGNQAEPFAYHAGAWNTGVPFPDFLKGLDGPPPGEPNPMPRIYLRAWDPVSQKKVWEVETTGASASSSSPHRRISGAMSTASGLVFQGNIDGKMRIFDAANGKHLHEIDVGTSMIAAPMTYAIDGEQYVAIMAGVGESPINIDYKYGNKGRIVAFKLGGGPVPKRALVDRSADEQPPPVADTGTSAEISLGQRLFQTHCAACHAGAARAPDLSRLDAEGHREFQDIVLTGTRASRGMVSFGGVLAPEEASAVHAYVTNLAWQRYNSSHADKSSAHAVTTQPISASASTSICSKPSKAGEPLRLLIVTGGHPYEPSEFFATFAAMPGISFQHLYFADAKPQSVPEGGLRQYDVVLFFDFQQKQAEDIAPEWRSLLDRGEGFVFLHHAIGSFPGSRDFKSIAGGQGNFLKDCRWVAVGCRSLSNASSRTCSPSR